MLNAKTLLAVLVLACAAAPGQAQVSLPPLPTTPATPLPELRAATTTLRDLTDLRRLRVRELLRVNRRALERDPQGEPIVRREAVAWSPSPEALARAEEAGFVVARETRLEDLDARVVVLRAPRGMSTRRALRRLRELDPEGVYDFNHVYTESGVTGAAWQPARGAGGGRVGLIDGGVDLAHPALRGARVVQRGFSGAAAASTHGLATASLLVGRADYFAGAAPGAELYVADVYCNAPTGGSADAIAQSLAWMARERVAVVNVSLVGPANATLRAAIAAMRARGHIIVAAVGNDGPAARPLYPAAYDGVVGVTGVDQRRRVLIEALRGAQVDFAAPGAGLEAAAEGGRFAAVRGTSFAAPIVAGLLAQRIAAPDRAAADRALASLAAEAVDLGARGRDDVYGAGLVGATLSDR
ncbi:MAG: S8 family serine peptidase [Alphaproteobacteria bacterium]|nr:S8 family serine peptidase [Alphaproteobacteria bacterium]